MVRQKPFLKWTTLRNDFSHGPCHFVVDFVLLGGTNSVLVIWGHLGINTVFRFS